MSSLSDTPMNNALKQLSNAPAGTAISLLGTLAAIANVRKLSDVSVGLDQSLTTKLKPIQAALERIEQAQKTPAPLPEDHTLPKEVSQLALRLNAWLGQIFINLLDQHDLSPQRLNRQLDQFRSEVSNEKSIYVNALNSLTLKINGNTLNGTKVVGRCLDNPFNDEQLSTALIDYENNKEAAHTALDLLCAERATMLAWLMSQVALQVSGNPGATQADYAKDGWTPLARSTSRKNTST